ncbi:MAG: hypothetical protein JWO77_2589 [Ilumatobacteraceae bacterium]|nr:hypothetical protein [Ilumatobacteraceae bacterium]
MLELSITFWQRRVVMWPASAMLTGNGVAFILRVPGTEHGDWWSLRGAPIFVSVAALSLLSKHVIRVRGRHLFNPSNLGLVVCFLVLGALHADPQDLWWGPLSPGIVAALVVIAAGGVAITYRQGLLGVAAPFFVTFAVGTGVLAWSGHAMTARWSSVPVEGASYWWVLVSSPEILVFSLFMITDPRTIPVGRVGRVVFGAGVAVVATLLVAPQRTEYATKVAILASLVLVCAARPLIERLAPAVEDERDDPRVWLRTAPSGRPALARRVPLLGLGAVAFLAATVGAGHGAREPRPVVSEAAAGERPDVEVPAGAVPAVEIGASAERTQPPLVDETAQQMGHDLVAGLLVAPGPSYEFETMTVELLRDPDEPQAPPRLGIAATGTVTSDGETVPFDGSFAMADAGGYFVITERLP